MKENHAVLECLKGMGEFHYLPNGGNLGDQAITCAVRALFRQEELPARPLTRGTVEGGKPFTLVYGGGGAFVPYHGMVPGLSRLFRHPLLQRVVILPSSFYQCDVLADYFDERFTVFCREEQSCRYLRGRNRRAHILKAHDMALGLDARGMADSLPGDMLSDPFFLEATAKVKESLYTAAEGKKILVCLRTDAEAWPEWGTLREGCRNCDLSGLVNGPTSNAERNLYLTRLFLHGLDQADVILTDRLHAAICALLLGKEVFLLDNAYGKVSAVYEYSLKGRFARARLLGGLQEFPYLRDVSRHTGDAGKGGRERTRLLVGICSAQKHARRRQAVRETWMKHTPEGVECLFFLGGEAPHGEEEDTAGLDAEDDYAHLPEKVLAFLRHALKHYDFDYLFKCDDDTYVRLDRLHSLCAPEYDLTGDDLLDTRHAPSGGAGYLLSRRMAEKLAQCRDLPRTGAEDLILGRMALHLGARPRVTERLNRDTTRFPAPDNELISAHWCDPVAMRRIDGLFLS